MKTILKKTDAPSAENNSDSVECHRADCPYRRPNSQSGPSQIREWIVNVIGAAVLVAILIFAAEPVMRYVQDACSKFADHLVWREHVEEW